MSRLALLVVALGVPAGATWSCIARPNEGCALGIMGAATSTASNGSWVCETAIQKVRSDDFVLVDIDTIVWCWPCTTESRCVLSSSSSLLLLLLCVCVEGGAGGGASSSQGDPSKRPERCPNAASVPGPMKKKSNDDITLSPPTRSSSRGSAAARAALAFGRNPTAGSSPFGPPTATPSLPRSPKGLVAAASYSAPPRLAPPRPATSCLGRVPISP